MTVRGQRKTRGSPLVSSCGADLVTPLLRWSSPAFLFAEKPFFDLEVSDLSLGASG